MTILKTAARETRTDLASLNNSHNNDNRNYANGLNISPNTHVQIDRSIDRSLRPTGCIRQT